MSADGRLSSCPSFVAVAAAAGDDDAEPVVASSPVTRPAADTATPEEAAAAPRRSAPARAAGDRRSRAACVWPAPTRWSSSRRRTGRRTARQRPRLPSGQPSSLFDGASLSTGSSETCWRERADCYAGTGDIRLVSCFFLVAAFLDCCGPLAALLMAWRHEAVWCMLCRLWRHHFMCGWYSSHRVRSHAKVLCSGLVNSWSLCFTSLKRLLKSTRKDMKILLKFMK